ncbi:MAG: flavodoxin family protein [Hyphomonadaceae bacterium]
MAKCLVVYYSWTGNTDKVGRAIAAALSADVEEIRELKPRAGLFAFIRSAIEASRRKPSAISTPAKDAAAYDMVILGSPVWAGEMTQALRAYIEREKTKFKAVAFFCTLGGADGQRALAGMGAACGRAPVAELLIDAAALKSGWRRQVHDFAQSLGAFGEKPKANA